MNFLAISSFLLNLAKLLLRVEYRAQVRWQRQVRVERVRAPRRQRRRPQEHRGTDIAKLLIMTQPRPLFVYFRPFLITFSIIQIATSIDGVLGI